MAGANTGSALRLRRLTDAVLGFLTVHTLRAIRLLPLDAMSNFSGALLRKIGPLLREHRIGRANLAAAFPEKSDAEIEHILQGVWDNLGRVGAEFAHIDRLWDYDPKKPSSQRRIMDSDESAEIFERLRRSGRPAIVFAAHLANWELPAVAATSYGLDTTVLYRQPNIKAVSDAIIALRAGCMGALVPTNIEAPMKLVEALRRGSHVAILVDQYYGPGVPVTFFGRRTKANPLIPWLLRKVDCPVHGIRIVRHSGNRFQLNLTEAISVPRHANGKINVQGTMQAITDVVEGWVREHPDQWLWVHRRWRDD
jgi:KDO2-lipid IV(A) lauroyltransferase